MKRRLIVGSQIVIMLAASFLFAAPEQSLLPDLVLAATLKSHVETISRPGQSYRLRTDAGGTIENESIRIEVVEGQTDNITIVSDRHPDFSSLKALANSVISKGMNDEQKALALWRFTMDNLYHGPWGTSFDSLEHITVYGYGFCGTFAAVLESLWWEAGLKARHVNTGNHAATEAYYDNDWHNIDAHRRTFLLEKDNRTIASLDDQNRDPDLQDIKRLRRASQPGQKKYYYMTMHPTPGGSSPPYDNRLNMAKGDILTFTWKKDGKWCLAKGAEGGDKPAPEPGVYANGVFEFRRNMADRNTHRAGMVTSQNIDWRDLTAGYVHPLRAKEEASLTYRVKVPFFIPFVKATGGFLRKNEMDAAAVDISVNDGKTWFTLWKADGLGVLKAEATTDSTQEITTEKPWKYSYLLRVRLYADKDPRDAGCSAIEGRTDLVYNPLILPTILTGENTFMVGFGSDSSPTVRVTHRWLESLPVSISNEAPMEGEDVVLKASVRNAGGAEARNVTVAFYQGGTGRGGKEIGRDTIERIGSAETVDATIKWKATRSTDGKNFRTTGAAITAVVDPDNRISEANESNNRYTRVIGVFDPPDASVPSDGFVSFKPKRGASDTLIVTATVRHLSGSPNYGYYISDHAEARGVIVKFFEGEPGKGRQIGLDQVVERLLPLEYRNVSVEWNIAKLRGRQELFLQVYPPDNRVRALGSKPPAVLFVPVNLDVYRTCKEEV